MNEASRPRFTGTRPSLRGVLVVLSLALGAPGCESQTDPSTNVASGSTANTPSTVALVDARQPPVRLENVAQKLGLGSPREAPRALPAAALPETSVPPLHHVMGGGIAWLDFDVDGDLDLFLTGGLADPSDARDRTRGHNRLYRNDDGVLVNVTEQAGVAGRGYALGAAVGDIDNDGDPDLYVSCHGPNLLHRNRGDGTFETLAGPTALEGTPFTAGAAFADLDGDGLVDLFVATYIDESDAPPPPCHETRADGSRVRVLCGPLAYRGARDHVFRNRGDGVFEEITDRAGIGRGVDRASKSLGVLAVDLDADGDVDLVVACDTTANLLYRNRGDGTFDEVGLESGLAASGSGAYEGGMGIAVVDHNRDARPDLLFTNFAEEPNRFHLSTGDGLYEDATDRLGFGQLSRALVGWGAAFVDFDLDGQEELFVANGHIYENIEEWQPERTYRQICFVQSLDAPSGRFVERALSFEPRARVHRGVAFADFDRDGGIDLCVTSLDEPPALLRSIRSEPGDRHHLSVRLVGSGPGGRDAVGARVTVRTPTRTLHRWRVGGGSYLCESSPALHFGLGASPRVERLTVEWPGGGEPTVLENLTVDREIEVRRQR